MPLSPNQKNGLIAFGIVTCTFGVLFLAYALFEAARRGPVRNDWKEHAAKTAALDAESRLLAQKIKSRQGKRKCKTDGDCRIVGLGPKVCDGYSNFLVYSTLDTDEDALLSTVETFNSKLGEFLALSFKVPSCGKKLRDATCSREVCASK